MLLVELVERSSRNVDDTEYRFPSPVRVKLLRKLLLGTVPSIFSTGTKKKMPPKRKEEEYVTSAEDAQTKREQWDGVLTPEIVIEIITHLPLVQIFSLHTLSRGIHGRLQSSQALWKHLVKRHWLEHNNKHWNRVVKYGKRCKKFKKKQKLPYANVMGSFCWGEKPTAEAEARWIEEASNEKCKLLVQTWALIEVWNKALSPLHYPDLPANMKPVMLPFYLWPGDDSQPFFKLLVKMFNEDCQAEAAEWPLQDFHAATMNLIAEIHEELEAEEAEREEARKKKYRGFLGRLLRCSFSQGDEFKERGDTAEVANGMEFEEANFPRGSKEKWEQFPKLFWENAKWTTMENPFISWHGGEIGPWEYMNKLFWGQRKDNSVVGFIAIVDNC